jgi:transposase-like protein
VIFAYVTCPFCRRVFDQIAEPNAPIRVDGTSRFACARCSEDFGLATERLAGLLPKRKSQGNGAPG